MFTNYFKTAIRHFRRNASSFLINVLGLSLGLACSILIFLWVADELSVNKFHTNLDRIYRVMEHQDYSGDIFTTSSTPGILAPALKDEIPEIEHAATVTWNMDHLFTVDDKSLKENGLYARKDFFHIFSFDLIAGSPDDVLAVPNSVVLSESLANKYFGNANPVGQAITVNQQTTYTVTGVFKDPTDNSTLKFDYVFPFEDWLERNQWATRWGNNGPHTYITLKEGAEAETVDAKIMNFIKDRAEGAIAELFLYPLSDAYLYSRFENGQPAGGRIEYVRLFSAVAFFILLIACINFMNLSTARSTKRAREVGIRKSIGASRGSLIGQYLGESMLIAFTGLLFAILFVEAFLPVFNNLTDKAISIDYTDPSLLLSFLGITLFTGLIAGSYPALYLSSFEAVKTLKGTIRSSAGEVFARKGLVIFQFSLSIILIVSTILIYKQIQYVQNKNLGYQTENLLYLPIEGELSDRWEPFRQELERRPDVMSVSRTNHRFLGRNSNTGDVHWPGKDEDAHVLFEMVQVDYDLLETVGIEMAEGRTFSRGFGADTARVIVNERATEIMQMEEPLGQSIRFWGSDWEIVGVAKDFHFQRLQFGIEPLMIILNPQNTGSAFIRVQSDNMPQTLGDIEAIYKEINPNYPFDYRFMDAEYARQYRSETRIGELAKYSAILAIIICCLGLFGLSAFTAEQRTKEIGIRKVLGASVRNLAAMLSKDFTKPVVIAILIAVPASWYLMNNWLNDYAYRIDIEWWVFAVSGGLALLIAWLTVSGQSVKAALMDPVKSLRSE